MIKKNLPKKPIAKKVALKKIAEKKIIAKKVIAKKIVTKKVVSQKAVQLKLVNNFLALVKSPKRMRAGEWKKLKYSNFKEKNISFTFLTKFLSAEKLHVIGAPTNLIIQHFGVENLKSGLKSNPHSPIIPFKEMRKAGVSAKELSKLHVQPGALLTAGYSRAEIVSTGAISKANLDSMANRINASTLKFHKSSKKPTLI
ncbi:MAG: hypothetical protein PHX27_02070 [Candidatus ainarchaeum sp.]|nr:hypothetical protein [Candidatus ainarchaeum sp.]